MKKILLLGGSAQQVIAIETAKKMGLYTVLCDYLSDNPGQYVSDKFYLVSTTDKEAVLDVAKKENIDGIIAYASDPAAPTAAYVAEKMNLPGNPYESVEILCNKDKFREFLKENSFNTPMSCGYSYMDKHIDKSIFQLPVIIKPVDSSGSKGATVLYSWDKFDEAREFALSFSRTNRFIVEEYIEKKHKYLIGGDIFVYNGKVILWGLLNCHRDKNVNPLVPVGKSYPLDLEESDINTVKQTLQNMINKLHIKSGAINVELIIDNKNRVFLIDIGPRNGGNMIPDLLGYIYDVDVVTMSIKAAMGEVITEKPSCGEGFYATYNLHSNMNGIYNGIEFSPHIEKNIIKKCVYKNVGDKIEYFDNASKAIGIVFMKFGNMNGMYRVLDDINTYIKIKVEE